MIPMYGKDIAFTAVLPILFDSSLKQSIRTVDTIAVHRIPLLIVLCNIMKGEGRVETECNQKSTNRELTKTDSRVAKCGIGFLLIAEARKHRGTANFYTVSAILS